MVSTVAGAGHSKILRPLRIVAGKASLLFYLCAVVLVASLILGGGTRGGFLSDAVLQLLAIPLFLVALWKLFETELTSQAKLAAWFCLAIAAIPLVQLIPLPPGLWTALPGREASIETFDILGQELPWLPISVSPHETWLSALSLIPPLGIFLGTLLLGYRQRRLLSLVILGVGVLSVFIGLLQVAQGARSPLRFFPFTNETEAVGFFANRNHFAALLYSLILFAAAWAINAAAAGGQGRRLKHYDTTSMVAMIGGFTLLVVLLAGEAMARSRAGLGFTMIALLGAFALGVSDRRVASKISPTKLLLGASTLAVIFAVQFALYRIMERFVVEPLQDARVPFARNTIEAALAYMPLGSGLGTFVPVYAMFEKPEDTIIGAYANRAHNDVLELWLETGVVGLVLMGMFVIWLALRSVELWRSAPVGARELDWSLARAATIVVALLAAHSFFDYPLRTGAMMAIMAFACALLIESPMGAESDDVWELQAKPERTRHRGRRKVAPTSPALRKPRPSGGASDPLPLPPDRRWGATVEWPEEWSKSPQPRSPRGKDNPPSSSEPSDN